MRPAHEYPSLIALRAFDATARTGSMTRAAASLNVTHSAISRHIRQIEKQLGAALFTRAHGRLTLTPAGHTLAQSTHESFSQLYACWESLQSAQQAQPLTLGCTGSLLSRWLIPRMASLPEVLQALRLHVVSTDDALDMAATGIDAAMVYLSPPLPQGYKAIPLHPERFGPVLSPALWAQHRTRTKALPTMLEEIMALPLLSTQSRLAAWPLWLEAQKHSVLPTHFQQSFQHALYLQEAAEASMGVAILPDVMVRDALTQHRLLAPLPFIETNDQLCLVINARLIDHAPRQANALIEWAKETLAKLPNLTIPLRHQS